MEQALELLEMVKTDNLKREGGGDLFNTQNKNKSSLATFSREFSNNVTIDNYKILEKTVLFPTW